MGQNSTTANAHGTELFMGEAWFDPIEAGIRDRVRGFIEELLEQEVTAALGRYRHERAAEAPNGYRNRARERERAAQVINLGHRGTSIRCIDRR